MNFNLSDKGGRRRRGGGREGDRTGGRQQLLGGARREREERRRAAAERRAATTVQRAVRRRLLRGAALRRELETRWDGELAEVEQGLSGDTAPHSGVRRRGLLLKAVWRLCGQLLLFHCAASEQDAERLHRVAAAVLRHLGAYCASARRPGTPGMWGAQPRRLCEACVARLDQCGAEEAVGQHQLQHQQLLPVMELRVLLTLTSPAALQAAALHPDVAVVVRGAAGAAGAAGVGAGAGAAAAPPLVAAAPAVATTGLAWSLTVHLSETSQLHRCLRRLRLAVSRRLSRMLCCCVGASCAGYRVTFDRPTFQSASRHLLLPLPIHTTRGVRCS
jgi:hypothetical protein